VPKIQLVTAYVNLSGSPDNVVFKGGDEPVTFPETLVLTALHGGEGNVHTVVVQGSVERSIAEEHARLTLIYGDAVGKVFPTVGGSAMMQLSDDALPTQAELDAGAAAATEAKAKMRGSKTKAATPTIVADETPALPGLSDLPD